MAKIGVIGSGFSGLSSSAMLANDGHEVTIYEKNADIGGRARKFSELGFLFDMGPSWYWMPDVFERYYNLFGYSTSDFYELVKLDPGFKVIFGTNDCVDIPSDFNELCNLFESIEKGSANQLRKFIEQAEYKYKVGMTDLIYQPGHSILEYCKWSVIKDTFKLQLFSSFSKHVRAYFKNPRLISILEFPVLFLGAMPQDTPALYSLMNFAGLKQGTFYPMGGFGKVIDAFEKIALEKGVQIQTSSVISAMKIANKSITHLVSDEHEIEVNAVLASADYHHIEKDLLPEVYRTYNEAYWNEKVFAPSCLIFYLGINKKVPELNHHNLFFDEDLAGHAEEIYKTKKWPTHPLFYVCCPSKTDLSVAPLGSENLFLLMPIATGLHDSETVRDEYFKVMIDRVTKYIGCDISKHIVLKKSYSVSDFTKDYNAYKGNAYGLANTLFQTAIFKPKMKSKKVNNLFFAGQLTVPGPGVPPSIISGQISANELIKYLKP